MADQLALFIDFENVAIWADEHFFDLDLTRLMEYLQSRGPVVIKRAYGDWRRFGKYRNDMLNNAMDLIQLYSVRVGKNRADIRLALDAFEVALIRPQVSTIVIMSGDSDFGPLASKLREYGKYVLGIGPREITHPLLVRSCDEFLYLETVMGQNLETLDTLASERDHARKLLRNALAVFGRKGELPVSASQLKSTMLSMDSPLTRPIWALTSFGVGWKTPWIWCVSTFGAWKCLWPRRISRYPKALRPSASPMPARLKPPRLAPNQSGRFSCRHLLQRRGRRHGSAPGCATGSLSGAKRKARRVGTGGSAGRIAGSLRFPGAGPQQDPAHAHLADGLLSAGV